MADLEETLIQTDTLITQAESVAEATDQYLEKITALKEQLDAVIDGTKQTREEIGGLSVDECLKEKARYQKDLQAGLTNLQVTLQSLYTGLAGHPMDPKAEE